MGSIPPRNVFSLAGWQFRHHSVGWKRIGPSLTETPVPTFHSHHCSVSDRWVTSQVELAEQSSGGTAWGYPNHLFFFILAKFHQISTYCTDFSMEKMAPKFAKFQRKTIPNRQVFMMSPPVGSQEYIRRSCGWSPLQLSQNWKKQPHLGPTWYLAQNSIKVPE